MDQTVHYVASIAESLDRIARALEEHNKLVEKAISVDRSVDGKRIAKTEPSPAALALAQLQQMIA